MLAVQAVHLLLLLVEVREVVVRVHVLVQALDAVQLVVDVQGADVAVFVRQPDADVFAAKVPHDLRFDFDVDVVEQVVPGGVDLFAGFGGEGAHVVDAGFEG